MTELDETALAKLAYEMAINIRSYKMVFADFGITEDEYYEISKLEFYKKAKETFTLEWNSVLSTADRVRLQAAAGSEVALPLMIKRMMRVDEPLANVIEGAKLLIKTAGIEAPKANAGNATDRFIITINLGADTEVYNKSIEINPNDINLGASNGQVVEQGPEVATLELIRPSG